jgi:uncharacterized protein (DUF488 family)
MSLKCKTFKSIDHLKKFLILKQNKYSNLGTWGGFIKTNAMKGNNYTISQEYLTRLENECLIEKIAKLEKELAQKELAIKMLKKNLELVNN